MSQGKMRALIVGCLAAVWAICFSLPFAPSALADNFPKVIMQTSKGTIVISVYTPFVPRNANNFLDLVGRGFYNGLMFHRVEDWVVQGGDPRGNGTGNFVDENGRSRYVPLEIHQALHHSAPGVVAMAHGPNPNSGSCQFYILKQSRMQIDGKYSIFGGVIRGMDVVNRLQPGDTIISAEIYNPNPVRRPSPSNLGPVQDLGGPNGGTGF